MRAGQIFGEPLLDGLSALQLTAISEPAGVIERLPQRHRQFVNRRVELQFTRIDQRQRSRGDERLPTRSDAEDRLRRDAFGTFRVTKTEPGSVREFTVLDHRDRAARHATFSRGSFHGSNQRLELVATLERDMHHRRFGNHRRATHEHQNEQNAEHAQCNERPSLRFPVEQRSPASRRERLE